MNPNRGFTHVVQRVIEHNIRNMGMDPQKKAATRLRYYGRAPITMASKRHLGPQQVDTFSTRLFVDPQWFARFPSGQRAASNNNLASGGQ